jgi:hypothetical protein
MKNRRTVLGLFSSIVIGGCTGFESFESRSSISQIATITAESSSTDFTFDGDILSSGSVDEPPRIRVIFENRGDPTGGIFGSTPPFSTHGATNENDVIASLIPENKEIVVGNTTTMFPDEPTENCWRLNAPPGFELRNNYTELDTGETLSTEFTVWVAPDEECLPPGEYSATFAPEEGEGSGPLVELTLSFTVES